MARMDAMPPEALLADYPEPMAAIARRLRLVVSGALPAGRAPARTAPERAPRLAR